MIISILTVILRQVALRGYITTRDKFFRDFDLISAQIKGFRDHSSYMLPEYTASDLC